MLRDRSLARVAKSFATATLTGLAITAATLSSTTVAGAVVVPHTVKMTLPKSVPPSPVFQKVGLCGVSGLSTTAACNQAIIEAIANARKTEPLPAIPSSFSLTAFDKLTLAEQVFAIANIERTARGLPAMAGMTTQLDAIAAAGASEQTDPSASLPLHLVTGGIATTYGSNWAEGTANPMGANYFWMYDDGLGSPNATCTKTHQASCWGHRENVLYDYENPAYCAKGSKLNILMGTAVVTSKVVFSPSITEIFVNDCGTLPTDMVFTWPDVQRLVFGH